MSIYRAISRITRTGYNRCRGFYSSASHQQLSHYTRFTSSEQVLGCRVISPWFSRSFRSGGPQPQYEEEDPFSLVSDELSIVANRLRSMVVAEVPKLASAAEYFFKMGVEGKRFRPTVILLMATALNNQISKPASEGVVDMLSTEFRTRLQAIAEITEMIHVASLLHDDVLDDADTRRGIGSLNFVMGNKISVLAGDFLLSRACITLASLKNTEVVSLIATAVEHLVTGETMQMSSSAEQLSNHEKWSERLNCERVLHSTEVNASTSNVEMKLNGWGPWSLSEDIQLIHTPGHTEGSVCLFYKPLKVLFTGDHLAMDESKLYISEQYNFYSVPIQLDSVAVLLELEFEWILPGHGRRVAFKDVDEKNASFKAFLTAKQHNHVY